MRPCNRFDDYRDKEMDAAGRREYEAHLAVCEECRAKKALLDNLVHVLKQEELPMPDLAGRIAHRAFQQSNDWDALVVSWLRPGPAFAALALVLILFSFVWLQPGNGSISAYSEYKNLMDEADAVNLETRMEQIETDSDLVVWIEQEGNRP